MKQYLKRVIPRSRPLQIVAGGLVVMLLLILSRSETPPAPRQEKAWIVNTVDVRASSIRPSLALFGQVQSPQDADLSAGIEAVVTEVLINDGDTVSAGTLLARLDDRDARLTLIEREADLQETAAQLKLSELRLQRAQDAYQKELRLLEITQSRFARSQNLFNKNVLSKNDFDAAQENLTRQELAVNQAELSMQENDSKRMELDAKMTRLSAMRDKSALDVERASIVAPFSGVISDLQISIGDRLRYGDAILRLQNPEAIEIRAQIPSRYAKSLRQSVAAGIAIPADVRAGGDTIRGHMLRISGQTRENSGGVDSFIGFSEAPLGLSLGSTVRGQLTLPPLDNVIAVPAEAVYGSNRIFRIVDNRLQMLVIDRMGEKSLGDGSTLVLIRSDQLSDSDQIVTTKLSNASDGLLVRVAVAPEQAIAKESSLSDTLASTPVRPDANNPAKETLTL